MTRQARNQRRSRLVRTLKFGLGLTLGLGLAAALALAYWVQQTWLGLPAVDSLAHYRPAQPLGIFSADGVLLGEYDAERRELVPLAVW
ncbi:hypothetical protein [Duganella violaceipulchra]|uniref:Membrane carboxypeptidase/penicillin-binding protein n=1 Tax=Duganella violaceipulchra TaxID=2849652 RepID=A0AA41HF28_9BURK|nr:hypothetical protein [Duganella violaceicalia]MBV6322508.1 hypothetical protein [Duganella violaceicalia]MCP2010720.1 membrane carboxypeptidase/penicillin-binding protein [Duganella violaceicalia]